MGELQLSMPSSPLQKIVGYARIENVLFLSLDKIWCQYGKQSRVEQGFFNQYYNNLTHGFAVQLIKPVQLKKQVSLQELKDNYSIIPPQSYRYLSQEILEAILV